MGRLLSPGSMSAVAMSRQPLLDTGNSPAFIDLSMLPP
jgi:hypothetical protein